MAGTVIDTADSWTDVIEKVALAKGSPGAEHLLWYRGQTDASHALLPKLLRYRNVNAEEPLLFDHYDDPLPVDAAEHGLDWERLFKMQHYNVPTRLLDWSESLGVAAFFAVDPDREALPPRPCIFALRLDAMGGPRLVPDGGQFSYQERYLGRSSPGTSAAILDDMPRRTRAVVPGKPNERLRAQLGRFTIHSEDVPLDIELERIPGALWQINLTSKAVEEIRAIMRHTGVSYRRLYPDFEGLAQWLTGRLEFVPNKAERDQIRKLFAERIEAAYENRNVPGAELGGLADIGFCSLGEDFLPREEVTRKIKRWLSRSSKEPEGESISRHPVLVLEGEAGSGKTNLLLHLVTSDALHREHTLDRDRNAIAIFRAADFQPGSRSPAFIEQVLQKALGWQRWSEMQDSVRRRMLNAWRKMLASGEVVLVLDGLDELARLKGTEAVRRIDRELSEILEGEDRARIIVSCRTHIWQRFQSEGILHNAETVDIGQLQADDILRYAERTLKGSPFQKFAKLHGDAFENELLKHPLFLKMVVEMLRSEGARQPESREQLFDCWFDSVLRRHKDVQNSDLDQEKENIATVAVRMLDGRSDAISRVALMNDDAGRLLWETVERQSRPVEPGAGLAIFSVRQDPQGQAGMAHEVSFTHQLIREFVLAWSIWKGIGPGGQAAIGSAAPSTCSHGEASRRQGAHCRDFISTTSAYDYEGAEMYSHLADLTQSDPNALLMAIKETADRAMVGPGVAPSEEPYWNNRLRNLFECFGMIAGKDSKTSTPQGGEGVEVALRLLQWPDPSLALRYRTKFNIVRCLCRLHPTSPTRQHEFISSVKWQQYLDSLEKHAIDEAHLRVSDRTGKTVWTIKNVIDAYAVRGFQRSHLAVHSRPPMAFVEPSIESAGELGRLDVSECLISIMEALDRQKELPLDAERLWLNCTFALIRWMPQEKTGNGGLASRLTKAVFHAENVCDSIVRQGALNVFWTLYLRKWGAHEKSFATACFDRKVQLGPVRFAFCKGRDPWPTLKKFGAYRNLPSRRTHELD